MSVDYESILPSLENASKHVAHLRALVGFDATVDVICQPVASRQATGEAFTPFRHMRDFGNRITAADGKSALIEIFKNQEKIGGNGPIMAHALAESGIGIDYIGPLGKDTLHPLYADFAKRVRVHSIADPAVTHALEFSNGKVMLTALSTYDEVTASTLDSMVGKKTVQDLARQSHLHCFLNWTCLPGYESILSWFLESILPDLDNNPQRLFFFDLADPSMRSKENLLRVLNLIQSFRLHGRVVLGLNLNETQQVCRALDLNEPSGEATSVSQAADAIRSSLGIHIVMSHPTPFAACASPDGKWAVAGPYTDSPKITTGAGDHLNAGFCLGLLCNFNPEDALMLGVLFSGYYVRHAHPPSLFDLPPFIQSLKANPS